MIAHHGGEEHEVKFQILRLRIMPIIEYILYYCMTFLRKPRDFPFPFSVRLHAAFGSLSSPDRTRSRAVRARSDQGARRSDPGVIPERFGGTP